jgi:hypothetical protein
MQISSYMYGKRLVYLYTYPITLANEVRNLLTSLNSADWPSGTLVTWKPYYLKDKIKEIINYEIK